MIRLAPNEKIILVLHRHWIVIVWEVFACVLALLVPFIATPLLAGLGLLPTIGSAIFFFSIYFMIVALAMFIIWIDFYLDEWIITTERIIDIDQRSLFNREISEFRLENVQDVTIEIPNVAATFLKYGNIKIQTAGEQSFTIKEVPHIYEAKDMIISYSEQTKNHH